MAKNHSLPHIILDFVGHNPPLVPSFPKYLDFSYIQVLYIPCCLCGLSIFFFWFFPFLIGSLELHIIVRCQATARVTGIMKIWVSLWIYFLNNCICFGCPFFAVDRDCMMFLSRMTTSSFLWVVKANLESVIMYVHRWKYFHHIYHFALNNSNFHPHFIIQLSMVVRWFWSFLLSVWDLATLDHFTNFTSFHILLFTPLFESLYKCSWIA